jgi:S-layer protein (TIGR01567 family)
LTRKWAMFTLIVLLITISNVNAINTTEVRGTVTDLGASAFTWDNSNFAGFYYDIDKNLGAETITFSLTDATPTGAMLTDQEVNGAPRGVVYETRAQLKKFKYKPWGQYDVIGFLADKYFAAYDPTVTADVANVDESVAYLYDASKNRNLMTYEQISKVLIDDNKEMTITSTNPLVLQQGYQLAIKSIDVDGKTYLVLSKNEQVVDGKVVQPSIFNSRMKDQTYYYKTTLGDTTDTIQIAIHFKNAFRGSDTNIATVDGEFQISDTVTPLKSDQQYDKMSIRSVDATGLAVIMDNKDNQITLSKNKDIVLMQDVHIKTADQDGTATTPLRYYIYKKITARGPYQLRGTVANVMQNQVTWDNSSFSGFYYDLDKNIGAETITFSLTDATPTGATLSDQEVNGAPRGIVYQAHAQTENFQFSPWGSFDVMAFLGESYFAGYRDNSTQILQYANSSNLLEFGYLTKILLDSGKEQVVSLGSAVEMMNGYSLKPTIGSDNKGILVELMNKGKVADRATIIPPDTYVYKTNVGNATGFPVIAAHFEEPVYVEGKGYCKIDGLWQISETPLTIVLGTQYGKMSIIYVNPIDMAIIMDNKDNQITLSKNKDIVLMQNIHIKIGDQDGTSATPERYYIYKLVDLQNPGGK